MDVAANDHNVVTSVDGQWSAFCVQREMFMIIMRNLLLKRKQAPPHKRLYPTESYNSQYYNQNSGRYTKVRFKRMNLSKDDEFVGTSSVRHRTDSQIRRHLLTCVVVMNCLRRIEIKMATVGQKHTIEEVLDDMRHLHYVLSVKKGRRTKVR